MTLVITTAATLITPTFRGPYPGLRPFELEDSTRFFGRGKQTNQMLERLEDRRFLAVVGASGCGKSSLVQAGLLPALAKGYLMDALPHWRMVTLRPGDSPLSNLAHALHSSLRNTETREAAADLLGVPLTLNTLNSGRFGLLEAITDARLHDDTNVLVLVDQFEEIFRFRDKVETSSVSEDVPQSKYERQNESLAFVNLLLTAATETPRQVYVILTMRSDFLGDCDQFQGLPEAIDRSQFLTPRMARDQLRDAIVGPLQLFQAEAEPALVDRILNEIGTDPDQLPLMQHALMRTWSLACQPPDEWRRTSIRLTVEHYANPHVGGVAKALDVHANEIYQSFAASSLSIGDGVHTVSSTKQNLNAYFLDIYKRIFELSFQKHFQNILEVTSRTLDAAEQRVPDQPGFFREVVKTPIRRLRVFLQVNKEPLPSPRQRVCERMFRCLSDVNPRGRVVRRLAKIQEIADVAGVSVQEVIAVAEPFLDPECSFLTKSPKDEPLSKDTTLDISHEALLRQWERLKGWIKTERQSADTYHRLARQAFLYRNEQASRWRRNDFAPVERWFEREQPTAAWAQRYVQPEREEAGFDDSLGFLKLSRDRETFWAFAKLALFVASIVFGFYFWRARNTAILAKKDAQTLRLSSEKILAQSLQLHTLPMEVGGNIIEAMMHRGNVSKAFEPLRSGNRPFATTPAIRNSIAEIETLIMDWEPVRDSSEADLQQAVFKLTKACREAWEKEQERAFDYLDSNSKLRMHNIMIGPSIQRCIRATHNLAEGKTETRENDLAEFERIYWSEFAFFETRDIERVMVQFRQELNRVDVNQSELRKLAIEIKSACSDQIGKTDDLVIHAFDEQVRLAKLAYAQQKFASAKEQYQDLFLQCLQDQSRRSSATSLDAARTASEKMTKAVEFHELIRAALENESDSTNFEAEFFKLLREANDTYPYETKFTEENLK